MSSMYVDGRFDRRRGCSFHWVVERWIEHGRAHRRCVVGLGTTADPAEALAQKKRRLARLKRRLAALGPRSVKGRARVERSISRLHIEIAKVEMFLGGPRVMVIARDGVRLYQRTEAT